MFLSRLLLEADEEPGYWIVRAPLVWCCERYGNIGVPIGFRTNLASIPALVQAVPGYHANGLTRRPATLHDYLYSTHTHTKADADLIFHAAMIADRVDPGVARACYEAVRLFGKQAWSIRAPSPPVQSIESPKKT